jgi:uncharacterized protein YkwD
MDRLKSILIYLIFSCPFVLIAADHSNFYSLYDYKNYRQCEALQNTINFDSIDYKLLNAAVFFRTNEIRVSHGKTALDFHSALEAAAQLHAGDMIKGNFFAHENTQRKDRKEPADRYRLSGIENPMPAENIANSFAIKYKANTAVYVIDQKEALYTYELNGKAIERHTFLSFAESVVQQWMNSAGHRDNILRETAVELGCACVFYREKEGSMPKFMCVQNFQLYQPVVLRK